MDLSSDRTSYDREALDPTALAADPLVQLRIWLDDAKAAKIGEPNAFCLATADEHSVPSARMVLLRGLDGRGLAFYSSYFSRKGQELEANPHAAATFFWQHLQRQVRIEGTVEQLGESESDAYFLSRPRGHRLSTWASEQSEPVESRAVLESRVGHFAERFEGEEVDRPHSWGGYLIVPIRIEFWQGRTDRLHDRILYTREGHNWTTTRLQP